MAWGEPTATGRGGPDESAAASVGVLATAARSRRTGWSAAGAVALAVLLKGKALLVGLKFLGLGKLFLTAGSMLAMIWMYARGNGWAFATLFVLLILVHELGHASAIRAEGLSAGYPVFIPFVGAFITLRGQPRNTLVEARIALAGPVAGGVASLACAAGFVLTGNRLWLAVAASGFIINLFNLTPLVPLDGGRVARAFSRRAWLVGVLVIGALCALAMSPLLILIGALALMQLLRPEPKPSADAEAEVAPRERRRMAARYFGLLGALSAGAWCASTILQR
jgi:Zn-dependent protease